MNSAKDILIELKAARETNALSAETYAIANVLDRMRNDISTLIAKQNKLAAQSTLEDCE